MDWLHKILTVLDHNRFLVMSIIGIALCATLLFSTQGCESTTLPLLGEENITRQELAQQAIQVQTGLDKKKAALDGGIAAYNLEVEALNQQIEAGMADLEAKDKIRADLLNVVAIVGEQAGAGTLNPYALIPLGVGIFGGLLGIGAGLDNRKKDAVILAQKSEIAKAAPPQ